MGLIGRTVWAGFVDAEGKFEPDITEDYCWTIGLAPAPPAPWNGDVPNDMPYGAEPYKTPSKKNRRRY